MENLGGGMTFKQITTGAGLGVDQPGAGFTKAQGGVAYAIIIPPTDGTGVTLEFYDGADATGTLLFRFRAASGVASPVFDPKWFVPYTTGLFCRLAALGGSTTGEAWVAYKQLRNI